MSTTLRRQAGADHGHGRWSIAGELACCRRAHCNLRTTLTHVQGPRGERWKLWLRRTDTDQAQYGDVCGVDPLQLVSELKRRWARETKLDIDSSLLLLYVVKVGPGIPDSSAEAAARAATPLEPRLTLREAGLTDGSSLLVGFPPPPVLGPLPLVQCAPSVFGKPETWQAAQFPGDDTPKPVLCFTPPHSFPEALPAALVTAVFGRFIDRVAAAEPVTAADGSAVYALCVAMCDRAYESEEDRARVLQEHLQKFGFTSNITSVPNCKARFDGLQVVEIAGMKVVLALGEWKNGVASSLTDTEFQLSACGSAVVHAAAVSKLRVHAESAYPILGVEVVGRMIRFSSLACLHGERVQWEPLTPFLNLLPSAQQAQLRTLAAALCAFRDAVVELQAEVVACFSAPPRAMSLARSPGAALPYLLRDGSRFNDVAPLATSSNTILYSAVTSPVREGAAGSKRPRETAADASPRPVLIKYVQGGYGYGVHASCAAAGLAPALHSCTPVPGGFTEVVMDRLDAAHWVCAGALSDAQLAECDADSRVERALARAHALPLDSAGGRGPCCHGDCRPANVMLRQGWSSTDSDEGVCFIDFDFCGGEGVTCYPAFMNSAVPWPAGAAPGAPLAQAHDLALWRASRRLVA